MLTLCATHVVTFEKLDTDTDVGMYVWHKPRGKINTNKQTTNTDKQTRQLHNAVYRYITAVPHFFVKENILKTEQVNVFLVYCVDNIPGTHTSMNPCVIQLQRTQQ